jgi:hypothetical protein
MKAHRATVELGLLGSWHLVAGALALTQVVGRDAPDLGLPVAVLGALVVAIAACVIGVAIRQLNAIDGMLPEKVQRVSLVWVATRVSLAGVIPVGGAILAANASPAAGWILGLAYIVLGVAICAAAVLATHVEHLCGARVWRSNLHFYFAR